MFTIITGNNDPGPSGRTLARKAGQPAMSDHRRLSAVIPAGGARHAARPSLRLRRPDLCKEHA